MWEGKKDSKKEHMRSSGMLGREGDKMEGECMCLTLYSMCANVKKKTVYCDNMARRQILRAA